MKYLITILIFIYSITGFSQKNKELKKFKCFMNMPKTVDKIKMMDTIFILYQKSDDKKFIQGKYEDCDNQYKQYHFMNSTIFPMQIFEYENWKRVNVREPKILYKKKSYICKNMYRTIDVNFLYNWELAFSATSFEKKVVFFIVELDSKSKNRYKIVQVNNPEYVIE